MTAKLMLLNEITQYDKCTVNLFTVCFFSKFREAAKPHTLPHFNLHTQHHFCLENSLFTLHVNEIDLQSLTAEAPTVGLQLCAHKLNQHDFKINISLNMSSETKWGWRGALSRSISSACWVTCVHSTAWTRVSSSVMFTLASPGSLCSSPVSESLFDCQRRHWRTAWTTLSWSIAPLLSFTAGHFMSHTLVRPNPPVAIKSPGRHVLSWTRPEALRVRQLQWWQPNKCLSTTGHGCFCRDQAKWLSANGTWTPREKYDRNRYKRKPVRVSLPLLWRHSGCHYANIPLQRGVG